MTTFGQAVKSCFNQYCGFKGRASRAEFWWFALFTAIVGFVLGSKDDNYKAIIRHFVLFVGIIEAFHLYSIKTRFLNCFKQQYL